MLCTMAQKGKCPLSMAVSPACILGLQLSAACPYWKSIEHTSKGDSRKQELSFVHYGLSCGACFECTNSGAATPLVSFNVESSVKWTSYTCTVELRITFFFHWYLFTLSILHNKWNSENCFCHLPNLEDSQWQMAKKSCIIGLNCQTSAAWSFKEMVNNWFFRWMNQESIKRKCWFRGSIF